MWAAWIVGAIALAGAAFMLRFLIALLSERAPSVWYWVVPARRERVKKGHLKVLCGIYFDDDCRAIESGRGDYLLELVENEDYAKEKCSSGLIARDVRPVSGGLGWRSIHPKRGSGFREHRL